jgi:hypothetical protein
MPQKFTNNSRGLLASAIASGATSLTLASGVGDLFPVANVGANTLPSANDWFKLTLTNLSNPATPPATVFREVVYVRTRTSGSSVLSDIMRGQEGTTARDWDVGTVAGLRMTADDVMNVVQSDWSNIPGTNQATAYTLQYSDGGRMVIHSGAGDVTIPAGVFSPADGAENVVVVCQASDSQCNLIGAAGVTLRWLNGVQGNRVLRPYAMASIVCIASNHFVVTGQGVA